jgi:dodecin
MPNSVYKIVEIVGTSPNSWEEAAKTALESAAKTLDDLRVAEVVKMDVALENGKITGYRTRLTVSFKYHPTKE